MRPGIDGSFDLRRGRIVFIPFGEPDPPLSITTMFCSGCQRDLPLSEFYYDRKGGRYKTPCIECQRTYQAKYRNVDRTREDAVVRELKECEDPNGETVGSVCWRDRD